MPLRMVGRVKKKQARGRLDVNVKGAVPGAVLGRDAKVNKRASADIKVKGKLVVAAKDVTAATIVLNFVSKDNIVPIHLDLNFHLIRSASQQVACDIDIAVEQTGPLACSRCCVKFLFK